MPRKPALVAERLLDRTSVPLTAHVRPTFFAEWLPTLGPTVGRRRKHRCHPAADG